MFYTLMNCLKGSSVLKAEGRFPERILNVASTSGIYVHNIKRDASDSIVFSVSKKGGEKLLCSNIEGLTLTLVESYGIPVFLERHKKRVFMFLLPLLFCMSIYVFSLFVWRVEITGGDSILKKQVSSFISKNGVAVGAYKKNIDSYDLKRKAILGIDDLSWMWVDVRGTTAKVKIRKRNPKPQMNEIHEPADVISMHSGVIEKMQVFCGIPLFKEGMTVEKGQVIITGILRSENENIPTYYHHACGNVVLRICERKTVNVPKKTIKKTPTGRTKNLYKINFKKNNVKFSLNSGISYAEYDKIEKKYKLPFLPITFSKIKYREIDVTTEDTLVSKEIENRRKTFLKELEKKNITTKNLTEDIIENEHYFSVTFIADCLVRADKEIPIREGETNGESS